MPPCPGQMDAGRGLGHGDGRHGRHMYRCRRAAHRRAAAVRAPCQENQWARGRLAIAFIIDTMSACVVTHCVHARGRECVCVCERESARARERERERARARAHTHNAEKVGGLRLLFLEDTTIACSGDNVMHNTVPLRASAGVNSTENAFQLRQPIGGRVPMPLSTACAVQTTMHTHAARSTRTGGTAKPMFAPSAAACLSVEPNER